MGVPGFYRWLVQRYPLVRRRLNDISRPKFDNFYVDFNCIVYNALRLASSSYPYTSLFQETCRYLDLLVQVVRPQRVLFIAVDGPAPFAKCAQQRSRRFVAARDATGGSFDTTSISVGTEFMEMLNNCLINFLAEKTATDAAWQKPKVIYSSHRVPGEGEHKFFNYIRSLKSHMSNNVTHCVYSPDADLIFLGLQTRLPYFYILREWDSWIGPHENVGNGKINKLRASDADFELISLSLAREYFKLDYPDIPDVNRIVDDFAAFSFLIGNDFIPHFPDISIQSGQFETIIETYQSTLMKKKQYLIEKGKINKQELKELLIASVQKMSQKKTKGGVSFSIDPNAAAAKYLKEKYPEEYETNPQELEKKLAFAALDSFDWVLEYYTKGCPSWSWCYPYFYAAPVTIIAKYCNEHKSHFEVDRPPMPVEQLLCILPPQSAPLLPEAARHLMFEPSPLSKFYPDKFEIDLNGRKFEHEGVVLIPLVDVVSVREEVAKILPNLSPEETIRNTKMEDLIFENGEYRAFNIDKDIVNSPSDAPICVPSLNNTKIPYKCTKDNIKVNIFNRASTATSLFLHAGNSYQNPIYTRASDVECLLNKPVLINWPYLHPALVVQIFDDKRDVIPKEARNDEQTNSNMRIAQLVKTFKEAYGIDIKDHTHIILVVRPIISSRIEEDQFRFSKTKIFYPYQLSISCLSAPSVIQRFAVPSNPPPTENSIAVIIDGSNKAKLCKILEIEGDEAKVEVIEKSSSLDLSNLFSDDHHEWRPYDDIIQKLHLNHDAVRMLLTSLPCQNDSEVNFAYTAFFDQRVLDGFCRKLNKEYEFTKEFIIQLCEYANSQAVGDLLDILRSSDIENLKNISPNDAWSGGPAELRNKAKELMAIMKNALCSKYYLIDKSIITISQTTLEKVENRIIQNTTTAVEGSVNTSISKEKLTNLLWPGKQKEFLQHGEIGSKVINISYTGSIPFGEIGYVVGVDPQKSEYHIVLLEEHIYGTTLRKRLNTKRGFITKGDDLYFY